MNRQSLRSLSTHDLVYYRLQLNWNIKVNNFLNYWVLSLDLSRFRETYFTAYLQFVANKSAISLFLGGFRVSVDISESISHVFKSLSSFCARISESFSYPHTYFRVSLNILESLSHVFQILSRFRGRISKSVSILRKTRWCAKAKSFQSLSRFIRGSVIYERRAHQWSTYLKYMHIAVLDPECSIFGGICHECVL